MRCLPAAASALLMAVLVPSLGWAADSAPAAPRIAVVNLERVVQEYQKTKESEAKLESLTQTKRKEREQIVSEAKRLRDEQMLLNEEARAERQDQIDEKLRQLASFDRKARDTLRKHRDQAIGGILNEIEVVVSAYAKEHNLDLVFSERAVLYGVKTLDLTDEVLRILNERYAKKES